MPRAVGWGKGGKGVNLRVNHMYICTCLPPVSVNFSYQYILDQLYTFIHSWFPSRVMFSSTPACRYQTTDYPNSCTLNLAHQEIIETNWELFIFLGCM